VRRLDGIAAGIFLGSWLLAAAFLLFSGLGGGATVPPRGIFPLAAAVGWLAGNLYVSGGRSAPGLRRVLLPLYLGGAPGLLWLYWSLVPPTLRLASAIAPLLALGVFALFFLVPVSLSGFPRRG